MTMTIGELRELIQDLDDNVEVRLAHRSNWPFEYSISRVEVVEVGGWDEDGMPRREDLTDEEWADYERLRAETEEKAKEIVYIGEGDQIGYLPGQACKALGWR
jgi:hypothetical protein